jgi:sugar phosphate isomerase/epimerase
MEHALSTHLIADHRLTTVWLERIREAGIPAVEFFCARQHLDYRNRAQVSEIGHFFEDSPLKLHAVHSPIYTDEVWGRSGPHSVLSITEPVKAKRVVVVDEIKRALELAEMAPFSYFIQHIGTGGEEYSDRGMDAAFTALEELSLFARQRGVQVLIENIPNGFSSAERLLSFVTETHLDLNFCFDTGHAHLHEGIPAAFEIMKERIRSTHLHDNNGAGDEHLPPFSGGPAGIDWRQTMRLLSSRPGQYPLLLELKEDPMKPVKFDEVNRIFRELEAL